jgi:two-component system cell cycle sensor histidine kinase PleC
MTRLQISKRRGPANSNIRAAPLHERAKESFLAAMSHELRTPLNAIIGFAELIDAEVFGPVAVPQYHGYVRDILASARHLLRIVEDVLEISRAEAGELVLNKREVDVLTLIGESLPTVDAQRRSKQIRIVADAPDHLVIKVDPEKMKRVLSALLSNAVKFSSDASDVRIAVRLHDCDMLTISVEDQGIGMDPHAVERAFAPFVQLDDDLSRQFDGSGLGLPLARLLTELHGGHVQLESAPGVGTTVSVTLPAYARAARSRPASDPAPR